MRVTRIEIFGFKSFMERLVFPLEGGITGVVGPNGCGKSNIVDALRWVLGETRASNLRGDVLEDVIFNGTENLRPLGLAEVTLTLRSTEKDFFADLVSPTLEAEAASNELLIQLAESGAKLDEALSEVKEEETGGEVVENERPKLTVIQGNLGAKPMTDQSESVVSIDEGSSVQEEVAQEESIEARQDEAPKVEKKPITQAITFLSRFSWLKAANEVQITRRLYRSGESEFFINRVACRLKDLKDLFRALGLGARAYTIVAQGEVSRIVSAKPEERRLIIEEAAGVLGFRDKIAAAKRRLEDTAINISRIDDLLTEVSRQVVTLKRQAQRARDRQALKDQILTLDRTLFIDNKFLIVAKRAQLEKVMHELKEQQSTDEAVLANIQAMEQEARSSLMTVDVETDQVRSKIDAIREELNNRAQQRSSRQSKINELKAYAVAAGNEKEGLVERLQTLESRRQQCKEEVERLSAEERTLAETLGELERGSNDSELKELGAQINQLKNQLRERDRVVRDVRDELVSNKSALNQINQQILASSPVTQLQKTLRMQEGELFGELTGSVKVLAESISVEPQYAKALQAILAEKAEFLITDKPHQVAKQFMQKKLEADPQDKKGLGLGVLRLLSGSSKPTELNLEGLNNDETKALLSCIKISEGYETVVTNLLSGVFVVSSLETALAYFENPQASDEVTLVTTSGDIISKNSFYSFRNDGGLIQMRTKADQIQIVCATLQDRHDGMAQEREVIVGQIRAGEEKQSQLLHEIQKRQAQVREVSNKHSSVNGRLQAEMRVQSQLQGDVDKNNRSMIDLDRRIENFRNEERRVIDELEKLVPEDETQIKNELETLRGEHSRLDVIRRDGHKKLSSVAVQLDGSRQSVDDVRARISRTSLEEQKLVIEERNLEERVVREYGEEFYQTLITDLQSYTQIEESEIDNVRSEMLKLKAKLVREGEVDPTSIERYEEENERLTNLNTQREDLKNAADTLERTISLLTETSKNRFVMTFEAVRKNFSELVPRVFGGGKADLELSDPNKPLESGVEIIVRPPGKKLRSIDLMSGGEKALCATALIFSMFMQRPSPLCVLDEVDAPLDEANLVRLLSLIKEMSKRTQFVMITHNKQSMVNADNLVGVTMQEPGASKVISVSLQEAFSQVA